MYLICLDDCKHVHYRISRERIHAGRFNEKEDERLFRAIRKVLNIPKKRKLTNLEMENNNSNNNETTTEAASASSSASSESPKKKKVKKVKVTISDLPVGDIPWEAVSIRMNNERTGNYS